MTSVFISYSTKDEKIATSIYNSLSAAGVETFLAGLSINAGEEWTDAIFRHLKSADWVFFLASKESAKSPAVQQELGASLVAGKVIIPVLIDLKPNELPGWMGKYQAIDLRNSPESLRSTINKIASKVRENKFWAGLILGAVIAGGIALMAKR